MIRFKILDTSTGLYSHGGYIPQWSDRGKSWDTLGAVVKYLKQYLRGYSSNPKWHRTGKAIPESCVVVSMKVTLTEINRTSVKDLVGEEVPCPIPVLKKPPSKTRLKNQRKPKSKSPKKTGKQSRD